MSARSERCLANAEKCQQFADAANISGTKRLYEVMASNWRQLAEQADWTDKIETRPLLVRQARFLRQIDKAEDAIRKFEVALEGEPYPAEQGMKGFRRHRSAALRAEHEGGSARRMGEKLMRA
jgi:hypothetical protein